MIGHVRILGIVFYLKPRSHLDSTFGSQVIHGIGIRVIPEQTILPIIPSTDIECGFLITTCKSQIMILGKKIVLI